MNPTKEQIEALVKFSQRYGRCWKSKLIAIWMYGQEDREVDGYLLRQIRNSYGPVWLRKVNLKTLEEK